MVESTLAKKLRPNMAGLMTALAPLHPYDAAEEIVSAMAEHTGVDWRQANIELLAKVLVAWAAITAAETEQELTHIANGRQP